MADDFRYGAAGETLDYGIQGGEAGREDFPRFEVGAKSERSGESGAWVHAISPFLRQDYCGAEEGNCQESRRRLLNETACGWSAARSLHVALLAVWRKHLYSYGGGRCINIICVAVYRKSVPTTSGNVAQELVGLSIDYA